MAITGHNTPQTVINLTDNTNIYTGSMNVVAGDLVEIHVWGWDVNNKEQPSVYWTFQFDGVTHTVAFETYSTGIDVAGAIYRFVAPSTGTKTVSVDFGGTGRACYAKGWALQGFDESSPVVGSAENTSYSSNVTTISSPSGLTTSRDGNVVLSSMLIRAGDFTSGASISGADGGAFTATGSSGTSDITNAYAYKKVDPIASVTISYSWTTGARCGALRSEINVAPLQNVYIGAAGESSVYLGSRTESQLYLGAKSLWP